MSTKQQNRRMTQHSRKWSSTGLGLDASEAEARRLEKKGTFSAVIDDESNTVSLSKDDFKSVMSKLSQHKKTAKRSQSNILYLAFGYLAVSVAFIGTIIGLVNWRLEATKETHINGGVLESRNGTVAQIGSVKSYAQLYDLPKFDVTTLSQVKFISVTLEDNSEYGFHVNQIKKKTGDNKVTFYSTNGDSVAIDGRSRASTATIGGELKLIKFTTAVPSSRRLFETSEVKLYNQQEFHELRQQLIQRKLTQGSAHLGYAELVMRAADAILDSEQTQTATQYTSALIKGRIMTRESGDENVFHFTVHRNKTDDSYQTHFSTVGRDSSSWIDSRSSSIATKNDNIFHCMPMDTSALTDSVGGAMEISDQAITEGLMISSSSENDYSTVMVIDSVALNQHSDIVFPTTEECYSSQKRYRPSFIEDTQTSRRLSTPSIDCQMIELAQVVYSDSGNRGDWTRKSSCGGKGTGFFCVGSCQNAFASLFENSAGEKTIAFRGSDDLVDFIKDIAGGTSSGLGPKMHRGVVEEVNKIKSCVNGWGQVDYITGHSLGGAMATVWARGVRAPSKKTVTFGALATSGTGSCNVGSSTSDVMRWANRNDPAVGNLPLFGWDRLGHVNHDLKKATSTSSNVVCTNYIHSWGCRNCNWRGCDCGWKRTGSCKPWGWSLRFGGAGTYGGMGCTDKQANMDITGLFGKAWDAHDLDNYKASMGCR